MTKYNPKLKSQIKHLRKQGYTYTEIQKHLQISIPKSSLFEICKFAPLPPQYLSKISELKVKNLSIARATASAVLQIKRENNLKSIESVNYPLSLQVWNRDTAKIILAILCLGEASKSNHSSVFSLGNTDPRIIILFIKLLQFCFPDFDSSKLRCTIQCRADQDIATLEKYWQNVTQIPPKQFYKTRIDSRTIGKPTSKINYMGVLKVDYLDTRKQLELESLANLIYNQVATGS